MAVKNKKSEFEHKVIDIRRVTRVIAGGKRFSFRVTVVAGNRNGEIGVGLGKAVDTASAIEKAFHCAKKNALKLKLTDDFSIPSKVKVKFASSKLILQPALKGRGLIAGSSVRTVLELAGIKNINAKILSRSKNKLNNARAAMKALGKFKM